MGTPSLLPMTTSVIRWLPRIATIAFALFLGMFAVGEAMPLGGGRTVGAAFVMHLAPAALLLAVLTISWKRPAIGAIVLLALALWYAAMTRRPDWILVISGPLALCAVLYMLSWRMLRPPADP